MQQFHKSEIFHDTKTVIMHQIDPVVTVPAGDRAFTLAFIIERDGTVHIGAAICAPDDQYCKAIGRAIATGRAKLMAAHWHSLVDPVGHLGPRQFGISGELESISKPICDRFGIDNEITKRLQKVLAYVHDLTA